MYTYSSNLTSACYWYAIHMYILYSSNLTSACILHYILVTLIQSVTGMLFTSIYILVNLYESVVTGMPLIHKLVTLHLPITGMLYYYIAYYNVYFGRELIIESCDTEVI